MGRQVAEVMGVMVMLLVIFPVAVAPAWRGDRRTVPVEVSLPSATPSVRTLSPAPPGPSPGRGPAGPRWMWIRLSSVVVMLDFLLTERTETGERAPGLRSGDEALETVVMVTGEQRPPVDPGRGLVRRPARLLLLHPGDPGPPGGPRLGRRRGGVALRHGGLLQPLLAEVAHEVVLLQHRVPDEAGGRLLLLLLLFLRVAPRRPSASPSQAFSL